MSLLCISSFFSPSVLLRLLKHVKLIIFENYNECKTKHFFLIKKVVTWFDKKKKTTWQKKSIDEEKNLLLSTLKKKTISEDSKKTLSLRTLKRILSMRNLKTTQSMEILVALGLSMTFAMQINSFWLFGNVIRYSGWSG